jgi:uncharacterized membrane protein HdeD (DUF308 family)
VTDTTHRPIGIARTLRTIAIVTGVVSLVAGLVILVWPLKSALVITVLIAIYAMVAGVIDIALATVSRGLSGWLRAGLALLGVLFVVASIVAFANLPSTTVLLAVVVSTFLGIAWILDGLLSLLALGGPKDPFTPVRRSRGWTIAFALVSILAGVVVLLSPLFTALWLWLFIGASLLVFGVIQIVRAATLER